MKDFWKKYNIWITIAGFLLLIVAAWIFALVPIRKSIESNSDEAQRKIIDGEMYVERVSKISEMEKTRSLLAENESNLRVFLDKNSEVDFIKKIEDIAAETGNKVSLKIEDESAAPKTKAAASKKNEDEIKKSLPKIEYLSMSISLEGNYEQAVNFLHKIENMNYYVDVLSISMNKSAVEAVVDPFAAEKAKTGVIATASEVIKSDFDVIVYLEK